MCGIFLVFDSFKSHQQTKAQIEKKLNLIFNKLKKRGPDYQDTWMWIYDDWFLFCGQSTLSITGKYNKNNFISKNRLFQILFNGQIYNFQKLNSAYSCDTEFLVNFLGKGLESLPSPTDNYLLERIVNFNQYLDGMYAYCLIDHREDKSEIYVSRDIQGEKSLYYHHNKESGRLIISSEISLIRDYLKIINQTELYSPELLQNYFMTRHLINDKETIYPNIFQLLPGETIQYSIKQKKILNNKIVGIDSLINPNLFYQNSQKSFDEVVKEFDDLFKEIAYEMVPKDLDYACIVSGGIDSSLSAYYCSKVKKPKKLIVINSVGKDWISNNLSLHEKTLNQKIQTIDLDEITYANHILDVQEVYQSPVHTHSAVSMAILTKEINKAKIKVLITGEGADEYFGGYSTYLQNLDINNDYQSCPSNYSKEVLFNIKFSIMTQYQTHIENFRKTLKRYWNQSLKSYSFLDNQSNNNNNNNDTKNEILYQAMILCDAWLQLPNIGLRVADLSGLMNGVESRTFFTRKKVIKKILNCPLWMKLDFQNQTTKLILRKLYLNYFPKESLFPKQGFSGFPNESKKYIKKCLESHIKNKSENNPDTNKNLKSILDIMNLEVYDYDNALEWKIINCDYFINSIQ